MAVKEEGNGTAATSTRDRILDAAVEEFAARGFAGARMDAIAARAGVSKQLPFHHFKSKELLFQAAVLSKLEEHKEDLHRWANGRDTLLQADHVYGEDRQLVRMLLWEALELEDRPIQDQHGRVAIYTEWIAGISDEQAAGTLDADLDPAQVVLSYLALSMFPYALPQLTYLVTGQRADDPVFHRDRVEHLEGLRAALRGHPHRS